MAELKTKVNKASVNEFLNAIEDDAVRKDCKEIAKIMKEVTKETPKMWGTSIVGYGSYHYKYASGREGDWFISGFSPRKHTITLYIMSGFDRYNKLLKKLGKHATGKSCLYIKRLADVDQKILKELIKESVKIMKEQ